MGWTAEGSDFKEIYVVIEKILKDMSDTICTEKMEFVFTLSV
jgi:hypothetical protein